MIFGAIAYRKFFPGKFCMVEKVYYFRIFKNIKM